MMIDCVFTLNFWDTSAKIAGIVTLGLAILTYWITWNKKRRSINRTRVYLNTELRSLYFYAIIPDILEYDEVVKSDFSKDFSAKAYDCLTIESIINSNQKFDLFKQPESINLIHLIYNLLKRIEKDYANYHNHAPKTINNKRKFYNFYFERRIVELRERILELVEIEGFLDLNVMPKKFVGHLPFLDEIKDSALLKLEKDIIIQKFSNEFIESKITSQINKYKYLKGLNEKAYSIIKDYLKGQFFRDIPDQNFGDD